MGWATLKRGIRVNKRNVLIRVVQVYAELKMLFKQPKAPEGPETLKTPESLSSLVAMVEKFPY